MDEKKVWLRVLLPEELDRAIRHKSLDENTKPQDVVRSFLQEWVKEPARQQGKGA